MSIYLPGRMGKGGTDFEDWDGNLKNYRNFWKNQQVMDSAKNLRNIKWKNSFSY